MRLNLNPPFHRDEYIVWVSYFCKNKLDMNILRLRARTIMVLLITNTACTTSYTTRGVQTTAATAIINNGESDVYRSSISFHGEKGYYPMTGVKTESESWIDAISDVSSVLGTDVLENYYHSCLAEGGYRSHYFYYYTLKLLYSEEERFDFQSGNLCCHRKEGKILEFPPALLKINGIMRPWTMESKMT